MITTFWMFAIFFGMISMVETKIFFGNGLSRIEILLWLFSVMMCAISIGIIKAGSWHNAIIFFTG